MSCNGFCYAVLPCWASNACEAIIYSLCGWVSIVIQKKSPFPNNRGVQATITLKGMVIDMAKKANDLAHTKWLCKYHIVFRPEYRRTLFSIHIDVIWERYSGNGVLWVEILEGHLRADHVPILVSISPKLSVSTFMGYLKKKIRVNDFRQARRSQV